MFCPSMQLFPTMPRHCYVALPSHPRFLSFFPVSFPSHYTLFRFPPGSTCPSCYPQAAMAGLHPISDVVIGSYYFRSNRPISEISFHINCSLPTSMETGGSGIAAYAQHTTAIPVRLPPRQYRTITKNIYTFHRKFQRMQSR